MKWPTLTRQKRKHEDALLLANSRQGSCLHDRHGKEIGSDGTTSGAFGKSGATAPSSTPAHFNMLTPAITMRVPIVLLLAVSTSLRAVSPLITDDAETVDKRRVQLRLAGAYLQQAGTRQFTTPFNAIYGVSSNCEAGVTFGVQWDGAHPAAKSVGWMALDTLSSVKYPWLDEAQSFLSFATRADVKVPTAPAHKVSAPAITTRDFSSSARRRGASSASTRTLVTA